MDDRNSGNNGDMVTEDEINMFKCGKDLAGRGDSLWFVSIRVGSTCEIYFLVFCSVFLHIHFLCIMQYILRLTEMVFMS